MQRYFSNDFHNNIFILSKEDSYHITKVMRLKPDEQIEIIHNKKTYISEIVELTPLVQAKVVKELTDNPELSYEVTLVQSLVKEQKIDYILQKSTELGVSKIIPYQAERSVVKTNDKVTRKIERWQTIVKEASEQAKRVMIPKITNVMSLNELKKIEGYDYKFIATVNEKQENLKKVLSNIEKGATMIIVVGPEGGFAQNEEAELMDNGFIPISLGKSVLRTETAGLFFMSVVRFIDME